MSKLEPTLSLPEPPGGPPAPGSEGGLSPGRPRSDEAQRAILDATLEVLSETGYDRLTVSAVAHRAGVGKATIYRRWPSKLPLVIEAIEQLPELPCPYTGNLVDDLTMLLGSIVRFLHSTPFARALAVLGAERSHDPELSQRLVPLFDLRRKPLQLVLERAVSRSELPRDIDLDAASDVIMGAINTRFFFTNNVLDPDNVRPFVEAALFGINRLRVQQEERTAKER